MMFQRLVVSNRGLSWSAGPRAGHVRQSPRVGGHRCRTSIICQATPQSKDAASLDVSGAVVSPTFRSTPKQVEQQEGPARILFVSESGVCRSVLALVFFQEEVRQRGLEGQVVAETRASRDYCIGDGPEASVLTVLNRVGLAPPEGHKAAQFDEAADIAAFDLVLVMDKFTAADVLREVSVFDTIDKSAGYNLKVRRLGAFHPQLAGKAEPDAQDIADPLYGNVGGEEEEVAVAEVAGLIQESVAGLVRHLQQLQAQQAQQAEQQGQQAEQEGDGGSSAGRLRAGVAAWVRRTEPMGWLVPPMLLRQV